MFLKQLNQEEKEIFLKLAIAVIRADEKIEKSEKAFITEYAHEMDISSYDLNIEVEANSLFKTVNETCSNSVKRIFLVELTACAYADGDFGKEESDLINSMIKEFGLEKSDLDECDELLKDYTSAAAALSRFIQEEK